ncbi:MAG: FlgD immunoglobulin-like domain containing protein [Bacteroidota bacterium]
MKTKLTLLTAFVLVLMATHSLVAQTIVPVEPDMAPNIGNLNTAIEDYQSNNGDPDLDVVFELESGGRYVLTGSIDYDFPLRIEAESGYTVRPIIQPGVPPGGGDPFRAFRVRDDLILRGLYITNEDPAGGVEDQIVRISAEGARIVLDDCHLDRANQSAFRLDDPDNRIFITNCIISNIYNLANPSNGRGIDDRGNDIDSLWVENSTFYNLSARLLRDDGGVINFIRWVNTTCVNTGDRTLNMGAAYEVDVRNNLFHNYAFMGSDEMNISTFRLDSVSVDSQTVTISHLNFSVDSADFDAAYGAINTEATTNTDVDSVFYRGTLDEGASFYVAQASAEATITTANLTFINAPNPPSDYVQSFNLDPTNLIPIDEGMGGVGPGETQLPFDFGYTASITVTQGGSDGTPLGDPRWNATTSNIRRPVRMVTSLNAGPNPFREQVTLRYTLEQPTEVSVDVLDVMGRTIHAFEIPQQAVGAQDLTWDGRMANGSPLPAGHYLVRLRAGDQTFSAHLLKE